MAVSVEKRIYDFLQQNKGKPFCDDCISSRVPRQEGGTINRTQVRNATSAFEVTNEFKRTEGPCTACRNNKKVIQAI